MTILTAQIKLERGLALSEADYEELLKNSESLESKQLATQLLIANIEHRYLIRLDRMIMQEDEIAAKQFVNKQLLRAERAEEKEARYYAELYTALNTRANTDTKGQESPHLTLDTLKIEMSSLLAKSQSSMTITELALQHKAVTANFNNQVTMALGASLTVPLTVNNQTLSMTLDVPKPTSKPIASATDILAYNPALKNEIKLDSSLGLHFAKHATIASMGHLNVLNKWREILEHNQDKLKAMGIDADNIQLNPRMLMQIDKATKSCLDDNAQLLAHLLENNRLAIEKTCLVGNKAAPIEKLPVSIAKLPTLFSRRPEIQVKRQRPEEDAHTITLR